MLPFEYDKIRPIEYYLGKPSSTLYHDLLDIKQEVFPENYRIIFSHFKLLDDNIVKNFIVELQKTLTFLDIPNFFVLLLSNDTSIESLLKSAREKYSIEDAEIGFKYIDCPKTSYEGDIVAVFNPPETICAQPWISLDIGPRGTFGPCCFYNEPIRNSDGVLFHAGKDSLESVYNSDSMKKLRSDFLSGKKPAGCVRCWNEEKDKVVSKRQLLKHRFKPGAGYTTNWEQNDISNLSYLSIEFGNICNLKCRICNPGVSSQIAVEAIENSSLENKKMSSAYRALQQGMWIKNESATIWDDLLNPNLKFIHLDIAGGEPMLSSRHFEVLQGLADSGRAKDISIHYNTNGTVFPEKYINILKEFKSIQIALSIDNLGKRFEYERSGASWDEVNDNINKFLSIRDIVFKIEIHLAINIQNVLYLPEMCDWIADKGFDSVHFSNVYSPQLMNISNLTADARDLVLDKLKKYHNNHQQTARYINDTIKILETARLSDGTEFCKYMQNLDKIRKESFLDSHTEIARAMGYKN